MYTKDPSAVISERREDIQSVSREATVSVVTFTQDQKDSYDTHLTVLLIAGVKRVMCCWVGNLRVCAGNAIFFIP